MEFRDISQLQKVSESQLWRWRKQLYWVFSFIPMASDRFDTMTKIESINAELADRIGSRSIRPDIPQNIHMNGKIYRLQSAIGNVHRYVSEDKFNPDAYVYNPSTYRDDIWEHLSLIERNKKKD